jgi:hypothetical protein
MVTKDEIVDGLIGATVIILVLGIRARYQRRTWQGVSMG